MKKLIFFCFSITILVAFPGVSGATHQYGCSGAIYGDSICSAASTINDWQGCLDKDEAGACVQLDTPIQNPAGTILRYRQAEFCEPSATCGHSTPTTPSPPTVELSASSYSITQGDFVTLSWAASDTAVSCFASGAWEGSRILSDSERVQPPTTSTYALTCADKQQQTGNNSVTITVSTPPPPQTSPTENTTQTANAGDTVTTDTEGDGATPSDPIETSVTTQAPGQVVIAEVPTSASAPAGFSFLARQVNVQAPGSLGNPLILSFQLHLDLVPAAANPNAIRVFKDRNPIAESCSGNSYPCVVNVAVSGDNVVITVHTLEASAWNFGFAQQAALGGLVPCGGPGQPACTLCHSFQLVKNILDKFLFPIVPVLAALLVAIGGFFFFTAAANPQNVAKGRTILLAVAIGLLIIYGAWLFLGLLFQSFGVASWTGLQDWSVGWEVECSVPTTISAPSVSLAASPATILSGQQTTLTWTVFGADNCTASGDPNWSGSIPAASGNKSVALSGAGNKILTLTCSSPGGPAIAQTTVAVLPPTDWAIYQEGVLFGTVRPIKTANDVVTFYNYDPSLNFYNPTDPAAPKTKDNETMVFLHEDTSTNIVSLVMVHRAGSDLNGGLVVSNFSGSALIGATFAVEDDPNTVSSPEGPYTIDAFGNTSNVEHGFGPAPLTDGLALSNISWSSSCVTANITLKKGVDRWVFVDPDTLTSRPLLDKSKSLQICKTPNLP